MTDRQTRYVAVLAKQRQLPDGDPKTAYVLRLIAGNAKQPNRQQTDAIFEWLKSLPLKDGQQAAPKPRSNRRPAPLGMWTGTGQISYAKLNSGAWGVRVATKQTPPSPGHQVFVNKADGGTKLERLGTVEMTDRGAFPAPATYYRIQRGR